MMKSGKVEGEGERRRGRGKMEGKGQDVGQERDKTGVGSKMTREGQDGGGGA